MQSVDTIMGDLANIFHLGTNYEIKIQYRIIKDDGRQYYYLKIVRGVYRGVIGEKPNRGFIFETDITKSDAERNTLINEKDFTNEQGVLTAKITKVPNDTVAAAAINPLLTKLKF